MLTQEELQAENAELKSEVARLRDIITTYSTQDMENIGSKDNPLLDSRASSTFVSTKSDDCASLNVTIKSLKSEIALDIDSIQMDLLALDKFDTELSRPFKDGIQVIKKSVDRMNTSVEHRSPSRLQCTWDDRLGDVLKSPNRLLNMTNQSGEINSKLNSIKKQHEKQRSRLNDLKPVQKRANIPRSGNSSMPPPGRSKTRVANRKRCQICTLLLSKGQSTAYCTIHGSAKLSRFIRF